MEKLKIPVGYKGISKTLRLPRDIMESIEALSEIKNTSLNQITVYLVKFALENLDTEDKEKIEKYKKSIK